MNADTGLPVRPSALPARPPSNLGAAPSQWDRSLTPPGDRTTECLRTVPTPWRTEPQLATARQNYRLPDPVPGQPTEDDLPKTFAVFWRATTGVRPHWRQLMRVTSCIHACIAPCLGLVFNTTEVDRTRQPRLA